MTTKMIEILRRLIRPAKLGRVLLLSVLVGAILQPVLVNQAQGGSIAPQENAREFGLQSINGFYAGYFRAIAGEGYAMFIFHDGRIAGVDIGGVLFDGTYEVTTDGAVSGKLGIKVPPGIPLIFGIKSPRSGLNYTIKLKTNIEEIKHRKFSVYTPLGPVTVRLVRTGDI